MKKIKDAKAKLSYLFRSPESDNMLAKPLLTKDERENSYNIDELKTQLVNIEQSIEKQNALLKQLIEDDFIAVNIRTELRLLQDSLKTFFNPTHDENYKAVVSADRRQSDSSVEAMIIAFAVIAVAYFFWGTP